MNRRSAKSELASPLSNPETLTRKKRPKKKPTVAGTSQPEFERVINLENESKPEPETFEMADNDPVEEPMWSTDAAAAPAVPSAIRRPPITAPTFKVEAQFLHQLRNILFYGRTRSDLIENLEEFDELYV